MGRDIPDDMEFGTAAADLTLPAPPVGDEDYRNAFQHAAEGMALCSVDGRIVQANRALCESLGCARPDVIGAKITDFLEKDAADLLLARLDLIKAGTVRSFRRDCRIVHTRGHALWVALSISLVRADGTGQSFLIVQARDVSENKQVERMLLDSERRFRTIFNSLSEGFVEADIDGQIVDVNDPLCRMLGFGREELIGRPIFNFMEIRNRDLIAVQMKSRTGERQKSFEVRLQTKRGKTVDAQIFTTTLTDFSGNVTGSTAIVLDVTERNVALAAMQSSEERYRTLVDSIQDGLVLIRDGRFEYVNAPFGDILNYMTGELIGHAVETVVAPEDRQRLIELQRTDDTPGSGTTMEIEASLIAHGGRRVAVTIHAATIQDRNHRALTIATIKDVTERRRIEAELRKLSSAVEHSPASVFITNINGVIEYVNPKFTEVTGYTAEEAVGHTPALLRSNETDTLVHRDLWGALKDGRPWRGEFRNKRKDGTLYWEFTSISPIRNERGDITHFVAVKEDVTSRKETELLNWRRANFDQITALPNRVLFRDRLEVALSKARRDGSRVAIMFIDLDRFKAVNDTLGHEAGDEVLRQVARRLAGCVRDSDTIARFAGDEFTAILPEPGPEKHITHVATRILEALRKPFEVDDGQEVFIGGSIGIATSPDDGVDANDLLKNADTAMYRAKDAGRNTYQFFTADMNIAVERRIRMETDMRKALIEGQFAVHFQPVVDAGTRKIRGAEALVRWSHPSRGLVPPNDFLPVAEEIGLIGEIGAMVLRRSCHQAQLWRDCGHTDLTISVNISGRQIISPDFIGSVEDALRDSGLPASALELEIAENLLLSDVPLVESALNAVAAMGIGLTIDDFGTGYSSLQHLRRFPFSTLKVDRTFIHDVLDNRDDAILVEAVIAMARKLGLAVVAEGVETEQQIDYLLTQYCDMFQGFLFGRALPAEEFTRLINGAAPPRVVRLVQND